MEYIRLAEIYNELESTSKRIKKTQILSDFLGKTSNISIMMNLLQGRVFPPGDERKIGMSSKLIVKVIAKTSGNSATRVEQLWARKGDLGIVAEELIKTKKQMTLAQSKITVEKVVENIQKLTEMTGEGTVDKKIGLISELLTSAKPVEAKFIVRTVLETLRTGVGESVIRDALVWKFFPKVIGIFYYCDTCKQFRFKDKKCSKCGNKFENKFSDEIKREFNKALIVKSLKDVKNLDQYEVIVPDNENLAREIYKSFVNKVQHAYDMSTDFGLIAETLKEKGIRAILKLDLTPGKPIKVLLYIKAKDIKDGFAHVGKPAIVEPKLDGFRMQIHGNNGQIKLYTRRLEEVTKQFPDVETVVKSNIRSNNFIIDCEIIGIDPETKHYTPFQNISQRIKRKHDIQNIIKQIPVVIILFDAMEINGENLLKVPLNERFKKLKAIIKQEKNKIEVIQQILTSSVKETEKFYQNALALGQEGIMMKKIDSIYKPGARVGYGVKVKPTMEPLDLVIVKAEYGEGKRTKWFSSFTLACRDKDQLLEMGKFGTGVKEKESEGITFRELTKLLKPLIIAEKGKQIIVKPHIIVEVTYQEIQESPKYSSGFALRFPTFKRLRTDEKSVKDINTLSDVKHLYSQQGK
ncbi:MAG: ATP-dependent DNA ligase [archaeon]